MAKREAGDGGDGSGCRGEVVVVAAVRQGERRVGLGLGLAEQGGRRVGLGGGLDGYWPQQWWRQSTATSSQIE